jgi:hypothetical protein
MEENGGGAPAVLQLDLDDAVMRESNRERQFVAGYMALMQCSERAARAVYMYRHVNPREPHIVLAA